MSDDLGSFEEFLDNLGGVDGDGEDSLFSHDQIVTLRSTTSGNDFPIPVDEPMSIADLLSRASLAVGQGIEYWVDGVQVDENHVVAPGGTITAIGTVKGG